MRSRLIDAALIAGLMLCASALRAAQLTAPAGPENLLLGAGKTLLLDMPVNIERVSVAAPETAEAVPVSARSLMLNGKAPGETSLVVWLDDGSRREYDVTVRVAAARLEAANQQLATEFGGSVHITLDNGSVFLSGRVTDLYAAQRAAAIAATVGKTVNLLKVDVAPQEAQILLKVRFADVDRTKSLSLGLNLFGAPGGFTSTATTGGLSPTTASTLTGSGGSQFTLADALNLFVWDPHANIGATLADLATRGVLEILAEPNVLAMNGHQASFVAGGEFPFPTLQGGGAGVGQVTIQFREYGVRLRFLPVITPRGTIRLRVTPEVSSLDYTNALTVSGFTIPALSTRRIDTEVELENGQSFAIAGLLDNNSTESFNRIPGLADIPILGKFFQSKTITKSNSELIVIVTPELVAPIPQGAPLPEIPRPDAFIQGPGVLSDPPRTPGTDKTGPAQKKAIRSEIPVQEMEKLVRDEAAAEAPTAAQSASPALGSLINSPAPAAQSGDQTGFADPGATPGR